jgi:UDP-N-acetylglucosamine:LPS N-acetylglucosamine transferase
LDWGTSPETWQSPKPSGAVEKTSWSPGWQETTRSFLAEAGEELHPQVDTYQSDTLPAERASSGGQLNLIEYLMKARKDWAQNVEAFRNIIQKDDFDVIVGDETYEILVAMLRKQVTTNVPFVIMYDFLGLDAMTWNPIERIGVYYWNYVWAKDGKVLSGGRNRALFVGELEDIPDKRFGVFLPNRREHGKAHYEFIGYVFPFDPGEYSTKETVKTSLGYGEEPLVMCAIGGTSMGKGLLELCGQAYPIIRQRIPDVRMVLVCGPRIPPESLDVPAGVGVRGFVPDLYKHFAASDIAVVQGGGTTTLELTALRRPFIYFPMEGQCEQEVAVASRLARHRAGIRMTYSETDATALAENILSHMGKEVSYEHIPVDGADRAAETILSLIP